MSEGTDKLIKRILSDAQAEADRILVEAQKRCDEIEQAARKRVAEIEEEGGKKAAQEENDIIFLAKKNAELEAKKADLALRHELIDEVFSDALSALSSMNANETADFLQRIIDRETDGGETIHPTADNRSIVKDVTERLNVKYKETGKQALLLGDNTDDISDGVIIAGRGFIKTCNYEDLLADLKEREIGEISDILF